MAVHDERGLGDGFEFREPLAAGLTPFGDRRPLRRHRLCRRGHVDVFLSRVPPRPEHLSGRLARLRRAREQIKVRLNWALPGGWIGQSAVLGISRILRWFARSWSGADENKAADQSGVAYRTSARYILRSRIPADRSAKFRAPQRNRQRAPPSHRSYLASRRLTRRPPHCRTE